MGSRTQWADDIVKAATEPFRQALAAPMPHQLAPPIVVVAQPGHRRFVGPYDTPLGRVQPYAVAARLGRQHTVALGVELARHLGEDCNRWRHMLAEQGHALEVGALPEIRMSYEMAIIPDDDEAHFIWIVQGDVVPTSFSIVAAQAAVFAGVR